MVRPWPRPLATKSLPLAAPITPSRHTIWQRGGGGGAGGALQPEEGRVDIQTSPTTPSYLSFLCALPQRSTTSRRETCVNRAGMMHTCTHVCVLYCDSVKGRKGQRAVRNL